MDKTLERVLIESLDDLEKGRPIEEILSEHPDKSEELRPVLEMANNLQSLKVAHSVGAQANSLDNFLAAASANKAAFGRSSGHFGFAVRRLAAVLGAVVLLLLFVGSTLAFASQSAIPGDTLYGAKVAIEDIRLTLVKDLPDRERLNSEFNQNRIDEISELLESARDASNLEFEGTIESIDGSSWVISGLQITVDDQLIEAGQFEIGQNVIVIVDVVNGEAAAISIIRTSRIEPVPEPETDAAKELEDAQETDPEPSPSMTPSLTPTPSPTPTQTPSPASIIAPTASPDPVPEETPESEEEDPDEDDSPEDEDESDDSGEEPEDDSEEEGSGSSGSSDHEEGGSDDDDSGSSGSDSESDESDDDEPDKNDEPDEDDEPDDDDKEP